MFSRHRSKPTHTTPSPPHCEPDRFNATDMNGSYASSSAHTSYDPLDDSTTTSRRRTQSSSSSSSHPLSLSIDTSSPPSSFDSDYASTSSPLRASTEVDSRPSLSRRTTETREEMERVGRNSESSDGGLRQSLELLRRTRWESGGLPVQDTDGEIAVLVHPVSPCVHPPQAAPCSVRHDVRMSSLLYLSAYAYTDRDLVLFLINSSSQPTPSPSSPSSTVSTLLTSARSTSSGRATPFTYARRSTSRSMRADFEEK
jgi:hypothetical protein